MTAAEVSFAELVVLLWREEVAVLTALALMIFICVAFLREERRIQARTERDFARYVAIQRLSMQREAARALDQQRGRALAEAFYRRHGFYPRRLGCS